METGPEKPCPINLERVMQKVMLVVCVFAGVAVYTTLAISAEDLAAAVKERRHLMKEVVAPSAKLGGQMVRGVKPFDAVAAAKAMNEINGVPDKYVKLFPKGTAHGEIADSEAKAKIWEDFTNFEATAMKLKDASAQAASAAAQGKGAFTAAFNDMTKVCKDCHQTYREKLKE
jgi:cytochrome c556